LLLSVITLLAACSHAQKPASSARAYRDQLPVPRLSAAYNRPYTVKGYRFIPLQTSRGYREAGVASWYGFESGNRTAMGLPFDPEGLSAAHRTLPLPTRVRVTNLSNNARLVVLVNDRGPFVPGRLIDLSYGAAKQLGIVDKGTARVLVEAAP
jgi:rare lipoprotein A